jgi:opacity protein-like surface antigen
MLAGRWGILLKMRKSYSTFICMKQKWYVALLPTFVLLAFGAHGQALYVTGFGGYTFQNKIEFSTIDCYVRNSAHYGISLEGINQEGIGLELLYQRQETHAPVYTKASPAVQLTSKDNLTISYIMLNTIFYMHANPTLSPYLGLGIGVSLLNTDAASASNNLSYSHSQSKFTWDAKLGVRLNMSEKAAIKLQSQFYAIANVNGSGIYSAEATTAWAFQFGFTAGFCYRLCKAKPKLK